jgi:hypothetical protein
MFRHPAPSIRQRLRSGINFLHASQKMLACLDAQERQKVTGQLVGIIKQVVQSSLTPGLSDPQQLDKALQHPDALAAIEQVLLDHENAAVSKYKKQRDAKTRNEARDKAIVRLRDEQHCTFGQIARDLPKINSTWVGANGKPLKYDTIQKAYQRMKKALAR